MKFIVSCFTTSTMQMTVAQHLVAIAIIIIPICVVYIGWEVYVASKEDKEK